MTIKTAVMLGVCSLALTGCGTVLTVLQGDEDAARGLRKQKTYCQSVPRIYSGLAYDFCLLNAPPDPTGVLIPFVLLDITLSGVLDTVALPYTIYRQAAHGNLGIYWRAGRG
ncbi:YceK/YidQ family lipoprotein [Pseudomonas sp. PB3P13]